MTAVLLLELYSFHTMKGLSDDVVARGVGPAPDMRFGFSAEEIYDWIEKLGVDGRETYLKMVAFDFFPYMEAYAILLGALLLQQLELAKLSKQVALIFPAAMICDMFETFIVGYAVKNYPETMVKPVYLDTVASTANQSKWILAVTGMLLLSLLFIYNSVRPSAHGKPSTDDPKKDD